MKGNQGLEALAALCGGRPNASDTPGGGAPIAATSNAGGSGTAPSSPQRTSPRASAAASPIVVKPPSSAATVAAANQLLIRQAAERNAAEAASQHQHPAVAISGATAVPGSAVIGNLTPQQISQAIVAAANSQGGRLDPSVAQSLLYPAALRGVAAGVAAVEAATPVAVGAAAGNNILANTMQQLVIQQYLQAQANAQQQQVQQQQQAQAQAAATAAATSGHQQAALLAMTMAAGKSGQPQQHFITTGAPAPIPTATAATTSNGASDPHRSTPGAQQAQAQAQALLQHAAQQQQQLNTAGYTSIKPTNTGIHQAIQQQYHLANGATAATAAGSAANLPSMIKIAASGGRILPSTDIAPQNSVAMRTGGANANAMDDSQGSKKQQKRAANRRSAQLSRKRKKQFIEELREENDDLRRKEQILRAIPDLIVVFDSSGRLGFVSESVGRFLAVPPDELEGTSFWDLICEESVRMLKAAFMDSLAAREADSDTAVLGSGVWELRLKDKSDFIIVTLNGVVHFTGDAPECVCCIRPVGEEQRPKKRQELDAQKQQQKKSTRSAQQLKTNDGNNAESGNGADKSNNLTVSCSDGASRSSDGSSNGTQQSVLGTHGGISMSEQDDAASDAKKRNKKFRRVRASSEEGDNENRSNSSNDNNDNINNLDADGTNNSVRISDGDSNDGIESD